MTINDRTERLSKLDEVMLKLKIIYKQGSSQEKVIKYNRLIFLIKNKADICLQSFKIVFKGPETRGLVVKAASLRSRGRGFESHLRHCRDHFSCTIHLDQRKDKTLFETVTWDCCVLQSCKWEGGYCGTVVLYNPAPWY